MRSWSNNKTKSHPRSTSSDSYTPITKRRLKTKPVLTLLAILFLGNIFWFVLWLVALFSHGGGDGEIIATVDGEGITRQEWITAMEALYGKEILNSLINEKVMEEAAKKNKISVSDHEIELEIALLRSTEDSMDFYLNNLEEQQLKQKVRSQIILEKVLTKDIVVDEELLATYYEEHQSAYNIPTSYRTSLIVLNTLDEALHVKKEIKSGSEFSFLARERSVDKRSAILGGNIGYVTASHSNVDSEIIKTVQNLKVDEVSEPLLLQNGLYGIVSVSEIIEGKSFNFDEVKQHIKRELAMEQLPTTISPESFWEEFHVTSYYSR